MDQDQFNELLPWLMLNTMYLRLLFLQNQLQRPLTQEEVEMSHDLTANEADGMLQGYRDGFEESL